MGSDRSVPWRTCLASFVPDSTPGTRSGLTQISLSQWPSPIPARRGTILDAALAAGVPFPHACQEGDCGRCKCALIEGEVQFDPYDDEALSDEERKNGLVLACRARPLTDVRVRWLADEDDACFPMRVCQTRVLEKHWLTPRVIRLRLAVRGAALHFAPGQFVRLTFGDLPSRCYALAGQPDRMELEFYVELREDGAASHYIAERLKEGDRVELDGPYGDAYWRGAHPGPVLLIADGCGYATIKSILQAALADGQRSLCFFHLGAGPLELYEQEQLTRLTERYGFEYCPLPVADGGCPAEAFEKAMEGRQIDWEHARLYMAGSPRTLAEVAKLALENGVDAAELVSEPYYPARLQRRESWWARLRGWWGGR